MKKFSFLISILVLVGILTACSDSGSDSSEESGESGEHVIRLSHLIQTDNAGHLASESFKEEIEKESDGKITVEIHPNGELYDSDRETVEAIQLDNIEMTIAGTTTLGTYDENFYTLDLPFIFDNKDVAREALSGEFGEKLTENLDDINLKSLGFGYDGIRHITNNQKPIQEVEDLKGLKMRVQESEIDSDVFKALGTNPSPLSFGELYTALQQNTFDGMDSTTSLIDTSNLYEVQEYLTLTSHSYSGAIMVINDNFFTGLPEDLQEIVEVAGENMEADYYKLQDESEEEALNKIKDEKLMEVNEITPENHDEFVDSVQSVYDKYQEIIDEDLIDLARSYND